MLQQLWSSVAGEVDLEQEDRKRALLEESTSKTQFENDDDYANHMLAQFPSYGSYAAALHQLQLSGSGGGGGDASSPSDKIKHKEGLLLGVDMLEDLLEEQDEQKEEDHLEEEEEEYSSFYRIPLDQAVLLGYSMRLPRHTMLQQQQQQQLSRAASPTPTAAAAAVQTNLEVDDWNLQEQRLWKSESDQDVPAITSTATTSTMKQSSVSIPPPANATSTTTYNGATHMEGTPVDWKEASRTRWSLAAAAAASTPTVTTSTLTSTTQSPNLQRGFSLPVSFSVKEESSVEPPPNTIMADDKQHWMPDKLCKECYNCELPFTVFRRRHHCRLCGQVFCSNCSAFFVQVPTTKGEVTTNSTHRRQVHSEHGSMNQSTHNAASEHSTASNSTGIASASTTTTTTLRACQLCYTQINRGLPLEDQNETANTTGGAATTSVANNPAATAVSPSPHHHPHNKHAEILLQPQHKEQPLLEPVEEFLGTAAAASTSAIQANATSSHGDKPPRDDDGDDKAARSKKNSHLVAEATAVAAARVHSPTSSSHTTTPAVHQKQANRHLGLTAASQLEQLGYSLIRSDAPLLLKEISNSDDTLEDWMNTLLTLATKCCATVQPDIKTKGDLLDIRPYCKLKIISGGSHQDCAYLSGVLFRKHVTHKHMAQELHHPSLLLLQGGIEFTRTENRIASLETLLEQEEKYMEILVGKILKLKPDILLVGRSVSRKAQELLLQARVVLVQHVKPTCMNRIARQTGATIISSTDHVMNQFGTNVLGKCRRFRLVTFRDNEVWTDQDAPHKHAVREEEVAAAEGSSTSTTSRAMVVAEPPNQTPATGRNRRNISALLQDKTLKNHERQAVLAANMLGENVIDGTEAVKRGLAKRGVAQTYIMLEGCPKHLGCTVVLRGASRAALKQVKSVFRFLINVAYNLKLETSYLRERCARLRPEYQVKPEHLFSSSLCVDYGNPPSGRKVRPWNGGNNETAQRSISGNITALDHQSILITSVWMTDKTQCCPAEVKGICYYSLQDVSLGQFLRDSCFNLSLKCQNPSCKKSVLDHSLSFIHNDGLINITVENMEEPLPPSPLENAGSSDTNSDDSILEDSPIATWTYCTNCAKVVTPLVYISDDTWKFSFGKFLEVFFYNRDAIMNSPEHGCSCQIQSAATLYFGCGRLAARFKYEKVQPFGVFVRRNLPIDESFHRAEALRQLELISAASSELFVKFDRHIAKVAREARSLFASAVNRPEHLQTVLSELNVIGSDVDHAARTLHDKISSVSEKCRISSTSGRDSGTIVNEALFRFPWYSRRYLYTLTSAWNQRLSAAGQVIASMSQRAEMPIIGDGGTDDVMEGMRRLRQLNEMYSKYSFTDINVLPTFPVSKATKHVDLPEYDDDIEEGPDGAIDFSDGVDADVLASRRRLYNSKQMSSLPSSGGEPVTDAPRPRPKKSLGTQRSVETSGPPSLPERASRIPRAKSDPSSPTSSAAAASQNLSKVTPGGAVKSAITRFFNRGGKELDPYIVDLGIFKDGRPTLEPCAGGLVVPVVDDQPSTVIAYSLSSVEYQRQFKRFSKMEAAPTNEKPPSGSSSQGRPNDVPLARSGTRATEGQKSVGPAVPSRNEQPKVPSSSTTPPPLDQRKDIERRMLTRNKSHIKNTFRDYDEKGQQTCKFVCTTYWATQFHAVRQAFLAPSSKDQSSSDASDAPSSMDIEKCYVQSLSSADSWDASGGKSGASFARTVDQRFVIKCISRTELQMFLDCAPAYFEYLNKAFFHGLPTVLCKIVGVYQIGYHNRVTGKRTMEQVAVMQNIFYGRKIAKTFDLKGSLRGRFARHLQKDAETPAAESSRRSSRAGSDDYDSSDNEDADSVLAIEEEDGTEGRTSSSSGTLLDGDFLEFTDGRPLPLSDRAKAVFHMSVLNDTLFLSIINVLDYSILVGIDEEKMELVVGIIDFMRQYDILKQMERVGKSLPMVVGSEAPTIIQPPLYKARFTNAMERYFMTVPNKWTTI